MDALGLIISVVVHAADIQDRDGARLVLGPLRHRFSRLRLIVADAIDNGGSPSGSVACGPGTSSA